jgi:glycerol-3-phosphate acyltransferase PlsY
VDVVEGLSVLAGYALGTFPTAALVGRRAGFDPTAAGSGNPGASNTYRLGGRRAGATVLVVDVAKGAAAAGLGAAAGGRGWALAAGTAAVLGHVAPVTRRFRGGKGVATAAGMAIVLYPLLSLVVAGLFAATVALTRVAAVASLVSVAALPVAVAVADHPGREVAATSLVAVLVAARHRENVQRLARGEERRLP